MILMSNSYPFNNSSAFKYSKTYEFRVLFLSKFHTNDENADKNIGLLFFGIVSKSFLTVFTYNEFKSKLLKIFK